MGKGSAARAIREDRKRTDEMLVKICSSGLFLPRNIFQMPPAPVQCLLGKETGNRSFW